MQAIDAAVRAPSGDEVLAGREYEVEVLIDALNRGRDVGGSAVVVRGEPGIGKSRLVAHAADVVAGRKWHVLYVRSDELERAIPYAALERAVAAARLQLTGELFTLATKLADALDMASEQPLARVHAAAVRLFSALRDEAPTALVVDDLQLLDDDTLAFVSSLLRHPGRNGLVLLGALRKPGVEPHEALAVLLHRLDQDGLLHLLDIGPLTEEGTAALVAAALGRAPEPALVSLVHQRSNGNPFFAVQTVLDLVETGGVHTDESGGYLSGAPAELSEDRRGAVLHRVLRMGSEGRLLARAIALLGSIQPGRLAIAAELAGLSVAETEAAFDALVQRGILRQVDGGYRFCHELVRDALYQELGPGERWRWHRIVADRLSEFPSTPAVELEVATHVREVAEMGDDNAITVLSRAAERACRAAPRTSVPWYRHALAITPPDDPRHPELTARLARALFLAGFPRDAADVGRSALGRLPAGLTRRRLASLVVEALTEVSALAEAVELIDAERAHDRESVRLSAQSSYVFAMAGRFDDAEEAASYASSRIDSSTLAERINALVSLSHMRFVTSGFGTVRPLLDELLRAAAAAPPTAALGAYATAAFLLAARGETSECGELIQKAQELIGECGWTLYRTELAAAQVHNAFHLGEWDSVLAVVDSTAKEFEEADVGVFYAVMRDVKAEIHAHRGEWSAARRATDHSPPPNTVFSVLHASTRAMIDLVSGDFPAARARFEGMLEDRAVPRPIRALLLTGLAEADAPTDPQRALRRLDEAADLGRGGLGHPAHIRGLLLRGELTGDIDAVREGMAVADAQSLALLRGQARLTLGALGVEPEPTLREAIEIFHGLGATPWRRRAAAELRRRGMKVPRHRAAATTLLTETEAQIARLVQLGRPNREIAMTVCLGVKTVEAYLSRIYAKTGCSTRLELARALDSGLLE